MPDTHTNDDRGTRSEIFGMSIDWVSMSVAADKVIELAQGPRSHLVVTPNTDHFLRWQDSALFQDIYSSASLVVPDGMPLVWLARLKGITRAQRVTGVDLLGASAALAAESHIPLAIIGGAPGVAQAAAANLCQTYADLKIISTISPTAEELADESFIADLANSLAEFSPKIVALCLGSPKQETFYARIRSVAGPGVFLAVGAAVDFYAGTISRAPKWIQRLGFEWLYRLALEPKRLWRRYLVEDRKIVLYLARALFAKDIKENHRSLDLPGVDE
jgi:N-acetylglucosaminyldiphosphoundecaprenol N-acetyl-beta-D-mannosaminyltransferase